MAHYFGCHVSAAGGMEKALIAGRELGINTIQLHASPPQRWNSKPFAPGVEDAFNEMRADSGVEKVFFHGIYLINLANPDKQQFHLSKSSLSFYLDLMNRISGDGVIFHVGSMKHQPDHKTGYKQIAEGIEWALDNAPGKARLILEVAAGSGDIIGDEMEELAEIYDLVSTKERVGFGLDSQHMWASGYDLRDNLEKVIKQVEKNFTFEKVWAVHLNDSKTELGSRKDRHENIGEGLIGKDALMRFFTHPELSEIPFILETPAMKERDSTAQEIKKLIAFNKSAKK